MAQAECIEAWPDIPESVRSEVGSRYGYLCDNPRQLVVRTRCGSFSRIYYLRVRPEVLMTSDVRLCRFRRGYRAPRGSGSSQQSLQATPKPASGQPHRYAADLTCFVDLVASCEHQALRAGVTLCSMARRGGPGLLTSCQRAWLHRSCPRVRTETNGSGDTALLWGGRNETSCHLLDSLAFRIFRPRSTLLMTLLSRAWIGGCLPNMSLQLLRAQRTG